MKNLRQQNKKKRENCTDLKNGIIPADKKNQQNILKLSQKSVSNMKIQLKESVFVPCDHIEDPILKTIKKKKTILQSSQKKDVMNELKVTNVPYLFALWRLSEAQILDGTKNLKKRNKLPVDDIPTKIIKDKKKNF